MDISDMCVCVPQLYDKYKDICNIYRKNIGIFVYIYVYTPTHPHTYKFKEGASPPALWKWKNHSWAL